LIITLKKLPDHAVEIRYGLPAFNANNLQQVKAVMQASAGARAYAEATYPRKMMEAAIDEHPHIPVCIHQDHGASIPVCLQSIIAEKNVSHAKQVKIIYGGSITPDNAEALLSMENIDGGLVGCCSINPQSFIKLCHVADQLNCGEVF
jgi:hypothetical protein